MTRRACLVLATLLAVSFGEFSPGLAAPNEAIGPESDLVLELMDFVDRASDLVRSLGIEAACEQFREPGPWYQGDSYLFMFDLEGRNVCHPSNPDLEGRNLLDLKDPLGKPIVRNMLSKVQGDSDEGWVHYLWPRPNQLTTFWKTAYVNKVTVGDGQEVVVGSGAYEIPMEKFFVVERVRDAVDLIRDLGEEAFDTLRDPSSGFLFYDVYVFVMDDTGHMLVNVAFPELEGTDVSGLEDPAGKAFAREMLQRMEEHEEAWVDYQIGRLSEAEPVGKSSYIRRLRRGDKTYIVGAGVYSQ